MTASMKECITDTPFGTVEIDVTKTMMNELCEDVTTEDTANFILNYKDLKFIRLESAGDILRFYAPLDENELCDFTVFALDDHIAGVVRTLIGNEYRQQNEEALECVIDFIYALEDAGLKKPSKHREDLGLYDGLQLIFYLLARDFLYFRVENARRKQEKK